MRYRGTYAPLLVVLVLASGCYRTTYLNLTPTEKTEAAPVPGAATQSHGHWQHFFLFGWIPEVKVIRAAQLCGTGRVQQIHTEQTFLQGLVETLASYYVNIYSPWTGMVVCTTGPSESPPTQPLQGEPAEADPPPPAP